MYLNEKQKYIFTYFLSKTIISYMKIIFKNEINNYIVAVVIQYYRNIIFDFGSY